MSDWLRRKRQEGETGPYVFSYLTGTRRGEPVQARTIERAVKEAGARAGLPAERCTPHKLRHSHATALMKAGRRLEEVQEILGHESIATTRIYAHLEPGHLSLGHPPALCSGPSSAGLGVAVGPGHQEGGA